MSLFKNVIALKLLSLEFLMASTRYVLSIHLIAYITYVILYEGAHLGISLQTIFLANPDYCRVFVTILSPCTGQCWITVVR